jgi:hypothetical protein
VAGEQGGVGPVTGRVSADIMSRNAPGQSIAPIEVAIQVSRGGHFEAFIKTQLGTGR